MIALKKQVDVNIWDTGRGMAKGFKRAAKALNSYLNEVRMVVTNLYNKLQLKGKRMTAQAIYLRFGAAAPCRALNRNKLSMLLPV